MHAEPDSHLRITLCDSDTGEFYKSPGGWVSNPEEATAFASQTHALEERERIQKPRLELLIVDEKKRLRYGLRLWK